MKALVELGTLHAALLGSLNAPRQYTKGAILTGEVFRFVRLDSTMPWFNIQTSDTASEDELSEVKIPAHLRPHLQRITFAFRPDNHLLWFVSEDRHDRMGPKAMVTFLQSLFDKTFLEKKASKVEVTAMSDTESLQTMLNLAKIDKLTIQLKRPNPDDFDELEASVLRRMESQNAQKHEIVLVAKAGKTITPDSETLALASVAANNGSVSVLGKDASGVRVEESTEKRPLQKTAVVNSDLETSMDVLVRSMYSL